MIIGRFGNMFFVLYYPALMGLALVTASRRLSLLFVTLTAGAYASISIAMSPGINVAGGDDQRLVARIMVMYALVIAANLIIRAERTKRAEAVDAERARAAENLELVTASQQEQLRTAEQRFRIRREIHDGLAQSLYGLSLNIESIAARAESTGADEVGGRLAKLIPVARGALLETRHYMHDLSPMLSEQGDIRSALENLAAEFQNISDIEVELNITNFKNGNEAHDADTDGAKPKIALEPEAATQICRIIQEALANVLRHSGATKVTVNVEYRPTGIGVAIEDNGRGFDSASTTGGVRSRPHHLAGRRARRHVRSDQPRGCGHTRPRRTSTAKGDRTEMIRVMLVDDHEVVRLGIESAIESAEGMTAVASVSDGAAALAEAPVLAPDVVLLDVLMPGMDGIETCRRLREELPETRVVMLTSHTDEDAVFAAIMAGASGYLLKNTSSRAIVDAVRSVAEGRSTLDPSVTAGVLKRLRTTDASSGVPGLRDLSEREHEVLLMVAEGLTNLEIAERLVLSPHTVRNHVSNILTKLDLRRRSDAAVFATRYRLTDKSDS